MHDPIGYFHSVRQRAGFLLLILSWFLLLTGSFFLPQKYFQLEYQSKVREEESGTVSREIRNLQDEAQIINEQVIQSNNELNALIRKSNEINNRVSELLEGALSSPSLRDSIDSLYQFQVNRIEPSIDSVNNVFNEKTDLLVEQLTEIRQLKQEIHIHEAAILMYKHHLFALRILGGFLLFTTLAGLLTGAILWIGSLRKWGRHINHAVAGSGKE
ncbi:MAG: hypothetical protein ACP5D1_02535 [Bacteroidales bacterium]